MPGAAYAPFCGDGDIAAECYGDRMIFGADIDPGRVATATSRLSACDIRVYDCDLWPFPDITDPFAVADFDSYSYPYDSFRAWWDNATKTTRLVVFFTDGQRQSIMRGKPFRVPGGAKVELPSVLHGGGERRKYYNFWLQKHCLPWLREAILPYRVIKHQSYLRGPTMLYWGAVLASK